MNLFVSILLLCMPPIALCVAVGGVLALIQGFRKGFGAHNPLPPTTLAIAAGVLVVHAGYFLAPVLLYTHHVALALWLVVPVGIAGSAGLVWMLAMTAGASDKARRTSMVLFGLLITYVLPPAVLILNFK